MCIFRFKLVTKDCCIGLEFSFPVSYCNSAHGAFATRPRACAFTEYEGTQFYFCNLVPKASVKLS